MYNQIVTAYYLCDDLLKALYHHKDWLCSSRASEEWEISLLTVQWQSTDCQPL
jgi:hypothetical protein